MLPESLYERIHRSGLIAVLTVERVAQALPLARALLAGGVDVMELTLRTPAAYDALAAIKAGAPEMLAGVGTVLRTEQVETVRRLGADFAVSPGTNPVVVSRAAEIGLPFVPGICTPSDVERAVELGCRVLKFFPAEPCGGMNYLRCLAAPYLSLGLRYLPLGGVNAANLEQYLSSSLVAAVGGTWLAPPEILAKGDWDTITRNARQAVDQVRAARKKISSDNA